MAFLTGVVRLLVRTDTGDEPAPPKGFDYVSRVPLGGRNAGNRAAGKSPTPLAGGRVAARQDARMALERTLAEDVRRNVPAQLTSMLNCIAMSDTEKNSDLPGVIADEIRSLVTRGVFAPGLQLRQTDLAERFGSSRVPVREALKLLTAEGVVDHDPNRGFFVTGLSSDEARQLYRMRHLLETEVLSTVAWPSSQQMSQLNEHVDKLEKLMKDGKRAEWAVQHREFLRTIFELSPQKVLVQEVLRLLRMTDRYRSLTPLEPSQSKVTSERNMLKALAARDRPRLLRVFEEDRQRIEDALVGTLVARSL
jgi:DNA-binding GntR family transcriptional regulator